MPTCSKCAEHMALLELAMVAMKVLAAANQPDEAYARAVVEVPEDLIQELHDAARVFNGEM